MNLLERFIKYVKIDTMSMEDTGVTPSTKKQFDLANELKLELEDLGLSDISLNEKCMLTATLKANYETNLTIGFFAHMDTIPGVSGTNVCPIVHKNYDGNIINLKNNIKLDPEEFPFLLNLKGKTLITTDGTTVLGADDKAGVAIIMDMLNYYKNNPNEKHVNIKVAFTPDEEIGGGIEEFDISKFSCDYAYTIDGGEINEINYENFNAAHAQVEIKGFDIHPGSAKGKMINASSVAFEFDRMLPADSRPEYTENYEGFNHLYDITGSVGQASMSYILRNHDSDKLEKQKESFYKIQEFLNYKYGENTVNVTIKDSYRNMAEIILKDPRCIEKAKKAISNVGLTPKASPIRGGTDGAHLTYSGLNTPNLGTGGYNCHGVHELACLEEMETMVKILIEISK